MSIGHLPFLYFHATLCVTSCARLLFHIGFTAFVWHTQNRNTKVVVILASVVAVVTVVAVNVIAKSQSYYSVHQSCEITTSFNATAVLTLQSLTLGSVTTSKLWCHIGGGIAFVAFVFISIFAFVYLLCIIKSLTK